MSRVNLKDYVCNQMLTLNRKSKHFAVLSAYGQQTIVSEMKTE